MMDAAEEARALRRALHRIPELGFQEEETAAFLWRELLKTGPDEIKRFCGTGIRAVYRCEGAGETVAFRSDMDALPIREETGLPYASMHEGRMHACGHDGHMTALLLLARRIAREKSALRRNAVLIFQPSEEVGCGAEKLVKAGVLENPRVDRIYACHLWPGIPKCCFATRPGVLMAQSCYPDIDIYGVSAHGANPDLGADALVAAAGLISAMQTVVSRRTPPKSSVVVTFGRVEGGSGRNIIADHVRLEGTVRAFDEKDFHSAVSRMEEIVRGVEQTYGVKIRMNTNDHYPCVVNDEALVKDLKRMLGDRLIWTDSVPNAEDFSFYQRERPGVMIFAGIEDGEHETRLHSPTFNFDESVLPEIAGVYMRILMENAEAKA